MRRALGAGTVVFHMQTASDTTFRLYDWTREMGLPARELQVEQALAAADLSMTPTWSRAEARGASALVSRTSQFDLYVLPPGRHALQAMGQGHAALLFVKRGAAALHTARGPYAMQAGRITVLPAALSGDATMESAGEASLLVVIVR